MTYEEALRLAEAIDATITPDDPRLQRTVQMVSRHNDSLNLWHNAFVIQFSDWYFVFTMYEGYWAFSTPEVASIRQFAIVPIEQADQ